MISENDVSAEVARLQELVASYWKMYECEFAEVKRLRDIVDDLAEYIRDLCFEHHTAPYQACPKCAEMLEVADNLETTGQ